MVAQLILVQPVRVQILDPQPKVFQFIEILFLLLKFVTKYWIIKKIEYFFLQIQKAEVETPAFCIIIFVKSSG